jgi:hypothetical protein
MASVNALQTLKNRLWPGHAQNDKSAFIGEIDVNRDIILAQIILLRQCFERLENYTRVEFTTAIKSFPPLRTFFNLRLFEAPVKPGTDVSRFQKILCEKFVIFYSASKEQQKNDTRDTRALSKETFDQLCALVVEVLDTSVFADPQRFPSSLGPLGAGSANTSSRWGYLGATFAVTTAAYAAYAKYATSSYNWTIANAGDLASILPLAFGAVREGQQTITTAKVIAAMLTAAAQMSCTARGVDSGALGSTIYRKIGMPDTGAPPTILFNLLPVLASGFWPVGPRVARTIGFSAANLYLTAQDYVNIPDGSFSRGSMDIQNFNALLDIYTKRTKSVGFVAHLECEWNKLQGFPDLKREFILPFLMDPVQISNRFASEFAASMDDGKDKELAKNIYPSIHAYFQNVAGRGGNVSAAKSFFIIPHDAEKRAVYLKSMDRIASEKLKSGQGALVEYVDGPRNYNRISDIEYNIQNFVNITKSDIIEFDGSNVEKLKAFLPQEDFLRSRHVRNIKNMTNALLFSMFEARNPDLKTSSENFLKSVLNDPEAGNNFNPSTNMDLVVELSTGIIHQPDYCLEMDKQMIQLYDHTLYHQAFVHPIIDDIMKKQVYIGPVTTLNEHRLADTIRQEFNQYPLIQTKLVKKLASTIQNAAGEETSSKTLQTQILKNMQLIDHPRLEKSDVNSKSLMKNILILGDEDQGGEVSQSRGQHWRMMRLFAYIRKTTKVMEASWNSGGITDDELRRKFNEFYDEIYENSIETIFPSADQSIFLHIWQKVTKFNAKGAVFSDSFLREMYDANKSIFWIPILVLVIKGKEIPMEYWQIAQAIEIPNSDAASYFDFLCRWVYPLSYDSDQKQKLLDFSRVLSRDGGFARLSTLSHYLPSRAFNKN